MSWWPIWFYLPRPPSQLNPAWCQLNVRLEFKSVKYCSSEPASKVDPRSHVNWGYHRVSFSRKLDFRQSHINIVHKTAWFRVKEKHHLIGWWIVYQTTTSNLHTNLSVLSPCLSWASWLLPAIFWLCELCDFTTIPTVYTFTTGKYPS